MLLGSDSSKCCLKGTLVIKNQAAQLVISHPQAIGELLSRCSILCAHNDAAKIKEHCTYLH